MAEPILLATRSRGESSKLVLQRHRPPTANTLSSVWLSAKPPFDALVRGRRASWPFFQARPGYSVSAALLAEPWNLWTDQHAVDIFRFYWGHFAERYRGIPGRRLSFNLINEPSHCSAAQYEKVIRAGVDAGPRRAHRARAPGSWR
jgi:hypothetical protein